MTRRSRDDLPSDPDRAAAHGGSELAALTAVVAELSARVTALESRRSADGLDHALLERLAARTATQGEGPVQGALTFAGSLRIGGRPLVWQRDLSVPDVLSGPAEGVASVLAALGHPDRVVVVRALLAGPRRSPELAELLGEASTGRLYHHLDKLVMAGVARQSERGVWEIEPAKIVAILVILGASGDVRGPPDMAG